MLYISTPIDRVHEASEEAQVQLDSMILVCKDALKDAGLRSFWPRDAFNGDIPGDDDMLAINTTAMSVCTGAIVLWPDQIRSLGCENEIDWFLAEKRLVCRAFDTRGVLPCVEAMLSDRSAQA